MTLLREALRFKSCQQHLNSKTQRCRRYGMHTNLVRGFVWRTRNMVIAEQQELESEKSFYHTSSPSVKDAHLCQRPAMLCTALAPLCRWLCVHVFDSFMFYMCFFILHVIFGSKWVFAFDLAAIRENVIIEHEIWV